MGNADVFVIFSPSMFIRFRKVVLYEWLYHIQVHYTPISSQCSLIPYWSHVETGLRYKNMTDSLVGLSALPKFIYSIASCLENLGVITCRISQFIRCKPADSPGVTRQTHMIQKALGSFCCNFSLIPPTLYRLIVMVSSLPRNERSTSAI